MFTVLCTQNTEAYVYVIGSLILCKHILLSLTLKENTIWNIFYYIRIEETLIQKGEHSWAFTELSLKRRGNTLNKIVYKHCLSALYTQIGIRLNNVDSIDCLH